MTKLNINEVKGKRKGVKEVLTKLRSEGKKTMAEDNTKSEMTAKPNDGNGIDPLGALAKTIKCFWKWVGYQVILPLILIGAIGICIRIVMGIEDSFVRMIGEGVLLIFSAFLLLGVFRTIDQAKDFSQIFSRNIEVDGWQIIILIGAIIFFCLYGLNIGDVYRCGDLVRAQRWSEAELLSNLKRWALGGLVGGLVAILFSLIGMWSTRKALER